MNIKKYFVFENYKNYLKNRLNKKYKISYSQCGEDIIISYALSALGINKPTYIDIGTNHPQVGNNTFLFYSNGSRGICIEPNPELFQIIKKIRKRDICLNCGIGPSENKNADYYIMSSGTLNTFIKSEAEKYVTDQNYGKQKIEKIISIPLVSIESIMNEYLHESLDILSLDTEGYDFAIIKFLNLSKHRPKIICVETARYNDNGKIEKQSDIIKYMLDNDYFLYADTYINSIFINKHIWNL